MSEPQHDADPTGAGARYTVSVHGSRRAGSTDVVDGWSDLDLHLQLDADLPLHAVREVDAAVWAREVAEDVGAGDAGSQVVRLVLVDGRRIDLVVSGGRLLLPRPDDPAADEVRFLLALAAAKLGRGDRLIGTHLLLEVLRRCLVEAMLLRDRDEGTTVHRHGTGRDALADEVTALAGLPVALMPRPNVLDRAADLFDRWHAERVPGHVADRRGLDGLLARGLAGHPRGEPG